jgi:hypothetical protein
MRHRFWNINRATSARIVAPLSVIVGVGIGVVEVKHAWALVGCIIARAIPVVQVEPLNTSTAVVDRGCIVSDIGEIVDELRLFRPEEVEEVVEAGATVSTLRDGRTIVFIVAEILETTGVDEATCSEVLLDRRGALSYKLGAILDIIIAETISPVVVGLAIRSRVDRTGGVEPRKRIRITCPVCHGNSSIELLADQSITLNELTTQGVTGNDDVL